MTATVFEERGLVAKLDPVAVTQDTAAKMLDCCTKTVRKLRASGALKTVMIGQKPHVTVASLRALVDGQAA